jgi:hypothetical protein
MAVLNTSSPVATPAVRRPAASPSKTCRRPVTRRAGGGSVTGGPALIVAPRVDDDRLAPQDVWRTAPVKLRPA